MSGESRTLADLKELVAGTPAAPVVAPVVEPKRDAQGRAYATGRRKDAVARVWVKPGSGRIICLAGDGSLSHHQRGRITSGQDRLGAECFGEGRNIDADGVHKAQSRRRVLVIDDDKGTAQRHAGLVLDAWMIAQKIGEELLLF